MKAPLPELDSEVVLAFTAPVVLNQRVLLGYARSAEELYWTELGLEEFLVRSRSVYMRDHGTTWYHGLKRIWEYLDELAPEGIPGTASGHCTRLMSYLVDPDSASPDTTTLFEEFRVQNQLTLAFSSKRYLDGYSQGSMVFHSSPAPLGELLARDAGLIYSLGRELHNAMDRGLWNLYRHVELPLMRVLYQMGRTGIGFDGAGCKARAEVIRPQWEAIHRELFGEREVDLGSVRDKYEMIQSLKVSLPAAPALRRDLRALRAAVAEKGRTDILVWLDLGEELAFLEKWSGYERLHPVWGQCSSVTSRVYARNPAVQNFSRKLRRLFIPAEGCVLVNVDYSQAQLRILAHLSGDPELHRVFHDPDGDVHRSTAEALGLKERREAKEVNFGICFGMGAESLARKLGEHITVEQAQSYIDEFNARHPRIEAFFAERWGAMKEDPPNQRTVRSPAGRLRRFGSYPTTKVERSFRATWTQQIEADLIKTAMVRLDTIFRHRAMQARLVMMIHDSIWVECPKKEEADVKRLMERMMVTAGKLDVPLKVDFE